MSDYDKDLLLRAYRRMKTIREFEERLNIEIQKGEIPGFTHLYAGQEAVAVGVCEQLGIDDYIVSTHRGHGHCIAKGCDVEGMMKEIYGRHDGLCKGKGGSMHIADRDVGMLGANAIVGGGPPIAVGAAIATKLDGKGRVTASFSGDGSSNQGTVFEAMNLAVVLQLPTLFVYENNGYSEHTGADYAIGAEDLATRTEGFGMPVERVDGNDFFAVFEATGRAVQRAREGGGPGALDCETTRFFGHFVGDPQKYRDKNEVAEHRANLDCLTKFRDRVTSEGWLKDAELNQVDDEVVALIETAVTQAKASPLPDIAELTTDVYATY